MQGSECKIKDDEYCPIYGWMLKLGLELYQVVIFAQIYGFTRTKGMFFYRREWLAKWAGCSAKEVDMVIGLLLYENLVTRQKVITDYGEAWVLVATLREEDM